MFKEEDYTKEKEREALKRLGFKLGLELSFFLNWPLEDQVGVTRSRMQGFRHA
ncbi:MAG TPA: hypothetical protein VEZ18_09510 [Geodermatophilus sp.]|nr:hypothetical protein [Geodermatophilus sp.]